MRRLLTSTLMAVVLALAVSAQDNCIYIEDFEIEPGTTDSVMVLFSNVDPSRGLQFNISMPEGLEINDYELTDYSRGYKMNGMLDYSQKNNCYVVFLYPLGMVCYPAGNATAVMCLELKAHKSFKGGSIVTWKCSGATMDNTTIYMDGKNTQVTVPKASLIGIPIDTKQDENQFYTPED